MAVTTFIPKLWNARLIEAMQKDLVASNFVNRDYEGEIRRQGDTVHINMLTNISVGNYTSSTDTSSAGALTTTDNTLVINQSKYWNFSVEDVDKIQAAGNLIDVAMGNAAEQLDDAADAYLFGVMASGADSGNIFADAACTASTIYGDIVKLRTLLDKANAPKVGRKLAVSPEAYALLLNCTYFTSVADASEEVVRTGVVGRCAGFDVYESNNVPVSGQVHKLIATVPAATTYAEQIVSTEAIRSTSRFADIVRGQHVYGAAVIRPTCIAVCNATI